MGSAGIGNTGAVHQLGFEEIDRTGFGGLLLDGEQSQETAPSREADARRMVVARSDGPTSAATRAALAGFRRSTAIRAAAAA